MKNYYITYFLKFLLLIFFILININVKADANPDIWPFLKEQVFKERPISEDQNFLKIDGPKRASSGAQVPVTVSLSSNEHKIVKIYMYIDANPGQHAATYFLTDQSQEIKISTRIRMETDSFVRAIAETDQGELFMSTVPIRASGGRATNVMLGAEIARPGSAIKRMCEGTEAIASRIGAQKASKSTGLFE